ncbi:MAG TPA: hypothetical protein VGD60_15905 [Candidatus Acidoferrales bacterium]
MLRTKDGQLNAVFACFGSAAQHAQLFEAELKRFLLAYNEIAKTHTAGVVENVERKAGKRTMGALLVEMRKHVRFGDDEIDAKIALALDRRNFLIHRFFLERAKKFESGKGRMELLAELVGIETDLETVRGWIGGLRVAMTESVAKNRKQSEPDDFVVFTAEIELPE